MKPKRNKGHSLDMLIASLQALISKGRDIPLLKVSLNRLIPSQFRSTSTPLYIIDLLKNPTTHRRLRRPPLDMSKPSQPMLGKFLLNWCHPDPIPNSFVSDSIPPCVPAKPPQHPHLCYTQLLDMSSFCRPTFSTV